MKPILEKLGTLFGEHGEKIGLAAAFLFFLAAMGGSGIVIPDVEGKVSDLGGFIKTVADAKMREFSHPVPDPTRPKPDDFRLSVPDLAFPAAKDLNKLVDRGGYTDVGVLEFKEGHDLAHDFTEAMESFRIGKLVIEDKSGKSTDVVAAKVSGAVVTFTAKLLPPNSGDWEGRFAIERQNANSLAATGILKVLKIREKSKLRDMPRLSGVSEVDPLKPGQVRVSWEPAAVAPQSFDKVRYLVERCEGSLVSGRWVLASPAPVDGTSFDDVDPAIEPGKTYHYRVRAVLGRDVEASADQIEAFAVPGKPDARVTAPTTPRSIDVPYTVMFRCDGFPSSGTRVSLTVWTWDAGKREWQMHKNIFLDPEQEIGAWAKGALVKGTGIKVHTIRDAKNEVRVKGIAAGSSYDDVLEAQKVYRLVRPVVSARSDISVFDGTPPGVAPAVQQGPGAGKAVEPSVEAAWREEIKAIQAGLKEINKLIGADKFDDAGAKTGEFIGKAAAAEQKMQGDLQKQAKTLKRDLERCRDKIQDERKKAEERAKKDKEESPLR